MSLTLELEPSNVCILIVEPAVFRRNLLGAFKLTAASSLVHCPAKNAVIEELQARQHGDTDEAAARIVEAVFGKGMSSGVLKESQGGMREDAELYNGSEEWKRGEYEYEYG